MASAPASVFNERPYDAFLSHAHADKSAGVEELFRWSKVAGLRVWYDSTNLAPGAVVASDLGKAIAQCRSGILVLSEHSIASNWVEREWNIFNQEKDENPDFQIIPIRIDKVDPPKIVKIQKWIDLPKQRMGASDAGQIVQALHRYHTTFEGIDGRRIYLSSGTRPREYEFTKIIKQQIGRLPTRTWIVRDVPRPDYNRVRIGELVEASNAVVAVASLRQGNATSAYIADEINVAIAQGVPTLVIREQGVVPTWPEDRVMTWEVPSLENASPADLESHILDFFEAPRPPPRPAYCFLGHAIEPDKHVFWDNALNTIQAVTGLKCFDGDRLRSESAPLEIAERIRQATYCVFDISQKENGQPALNTCIEAGIRIGVDKPYGLICRGPRGIPPFMFGTKQVEYYADDAEMVARLRHLCLPYQRLLE